MSEMSWQLRHPDYGLMRIDLEETTEREGWTGKYLDSTRSLFTSTVDGTTRKLSYTDTDDSSWWSAVASSCRSFAGKERG